jgi:hypothetical protein
VSAIRAAVAASRSASTSRRAASRSLTASEFAARQDRAEANGEALSCEHPALESARGVDGPF